MTDKTDGGTPRTDEFVVDQEKREVSIWDALKNIQNFARTLERENAELREKLEFEWHGTLGSHSLLETAYKQRDALREQLKEATANMHKVNDDRIRLAIELSELLCRLGDPWLDEKQTA